MQCDDFYVHHSPYQGNGDRCNRNEVDAGTAAQISLLGLTTTFCGVLNLFVAGWLIKRFGVKVALVVQTGCPALRVATQVAAVALGGRADITIIQSTQLVSILGGSAGYLLVLNTAIGEVVEPKERTGIFGQLQGCVMLGTAIGYLVGGIVEDIYGIRRPCDVAFILFTCSCMYAGLFTTSVEQPSMTSGSDQKPKGLGVLLGPLKVLLPQQLRLQNGGAAKHYGVLLLSLGVFMGVLATGYAPILIQMYATAAFQFRSSDNGYLMSVNSLIRGLFLIFAFPSIISNGRKWSARSQRTDNEETKDDRAIPTEPEEFDPPEGILPGQEPPPQLARIEEEDGRSFDLLFLRWSLVADGLVTAYTALASRSWHIYLASILLPLASGSAPASKGVITEMVPASQRAIALQAMTLVESTAMLSIMGLFGFIFSAFSGIGKADLTFYCNAIRAFAAACVLVLSRFPPAGSHLAAEEDSDAADNCADANRPTCSHA